MIVIALQFHDADRLQADALARLMADLEPRRREDVRIRFIARKDCPMLDMDTISYVGRRFDVSWAHTSSAADGWPAGPNAMAKEILHDAKGWLKDAGWTDCRAILMLEPDNVVLRGWLDALITEWLMAETLGEVVMGAWRDSGGAFGHINGNCLIAADVARTLSSHITQHLAWDCAIAPFIKDRWRKTDLIRNIFQTASLTRAQWEEVSRGAAIVHGVKDGSAMRWARENFALTT